LTTGVEAKALIATMWSEYSIDKLMLTFYILPFYQA